MEERLGKRIQRLRGDERMREVERVVSAWEASGKPKREFCEDMGISTQSLTRWVAKVAGSTRTAPDVTSLVEVTPSRSPAAHAVLELTLPGGARIHVPPGFDESDVARLLRVVQAAC